jgi:hypothetical protein
VTEDYPIKPRHLDTSMEPKGFDLLLDYNDRMILWAFVQFWQSKSNWDPFTHEEFIAFISNYESKVNSSVRSGVILFVTATLKSILHYNEGGNGTTIYGPSHFVISTYFLWNPA